MTWLPPPDLEAGPRWPTMSELLALVVVLAFVAAYFLRPSPEMGGALIGGFNIAIGYYLGSSKGAKDNREQLNRQLDRLSGPPPAGGAP